MPLLNQQSDSAPYGRAAIVRCLVAGTFVLSAPVLVACQRGTRGDASDAVRSEAQSSVGAAVDIAERIGRIERGLLPAIAVRGRADTTFVLADRLRRYGVPAVSIAVIDGGRVVWARAYGKVEAGRSEPVDTTTLFQAGSIGKMVTSVAALRLVDEGVLKLDENVNNRLAAWKVPESALTSDSPVTLRRLLSHGAGVGVASFYPGYKPGEPVPSLRQVLDGLPPATNPPVRVEIKPGTEWRYSGGGTSIVQQLLVEVTKTDFPSFMQRVVLEPAGMRRSTFVLPETTDLRGHATAHSPADAPVPGRWRTHPELAAAGMWSTPSDLAQFGVMLLNVKRGASATILKPGTALKMLTRQIGSWGLGVALSGGSGDSATFGHEGSTVGFTSRLLLFGETGQGVAIMTNGESEALINEITRSVASEYKWPVRSRPEKLVARVDPAGFAALAGKYRIRLGERIIDVSVTTDGQHLFFIGSSGRPAAHAPSRQTSVLFPGIRHGDHLHCAEWWCGQGSHH
ncbi:MAG: beta-lactamase family protein [Anaerolineae bacterium]|nr:beta-lactamase family protein [Gemmatimonadaceae bacterium]